MNEAKLSNNELIRRLNELREVIVNDDISKIAREDEEIQDLLYEYKKGKSIWGGADVIISEKTSKDCLFLLSLILVDLSRFHGRNRYSWTWRSSFCSKENETLMLDKKRIFVSSCFLLMFRCCNCS